MLCDKCKAREASVHVTQIVNGVQYAQNLCGECAGMAAGMLGNMMNAGNMNLDLLRSWFAGNMAGVPMQGDSGLEGWQEVSAPQSSEQKFEALGLRLPKTAGLPKEETPVQEAKPGRAQLEAELKEAVEREEYEKAARLRDQIRALNK